MKKQVCYLAGPMSGRRDLGLSYREPLIKALSKHFKVICPRSVEIAQNIGVEASIFQDLKIVENVDVVVAYVPEYSCGTMAEVVHAYHHGIPVLIIFDPKFHVTPESWLTNVMVHGVASKKFKQREIDLLVECYQRDIRFWKKDRVRAKKRGTKAADKILHQEGL